MTDTNLNRALHEARKLRILNRALHRLAAVVENPRPNEETAQQQELTAWDGQ